MGKSTMVDYATWSKRLTNSVPDPNNPAFDCKNSYESPPSLNITDPTSKIFDIASLRLTDYQVRVLMADRFVDEIFNSPSESDYYAWMGVFTWGTSLIAILGEPMAATWTNLTSVGGLDAFIQSLRQKVINGDLLC